MPKYIIKEGLLDKAVDTLISAFASNQKSTKLKDLEKQDPEIRKISQNIQKSKDELKQYLEKQRKKEGTTDKIDKLAKDLGL